MPLIEDATRNEATVRRYFTEIIDQRNMAALAECFHPEVKIQRADLSQPLAGLEAVEGFLRISHVAVRQVRSEILDVVADENRVCTRVRHDAVMGDWVMTPLGLCSPGGKEVTWTALALFELKDGLITGEHVIRDEVSILRQVGMIPNAAA